MGAIYAKQVPDHLVEILDKWRQQQIPILNRQQAVIHVLHEWIEVHREELVRDRIIADEQMSLFNEN